MSEETERAVEDAIRAHIADENDGAFLTSWHVVAAAAIPDNPDATIYQYLTSDGPGHVMLGLLAMAQRRATRWIDGDE